MYKYISNGWRVTATPQKLLRYVPKNVSKSWSCNQSLKYPRSKSDQTSLRCGGTNKFHEWTHNVWDLDSFIGTGLLGVSCGTRHPLSPICSNSDCSGKSCESWIMLGSGEFGGQIFVTFLWQFRSSFSSVAGLVVPLWEATTIIECRCLERLYLVQVFPVKCCTVARWSMLFTSPISGFNVLADQCIFHLNQKATQNLSRLFSVCTGASGPQVKASLLFMGLIIK